MTQIIILIKSGGYSFIREIGHFPLLVLKHLVSEHGCRVALLLNFGGPSVLIKRFIN